MKKNRFTLRAAVYLILLKDNHILLQRRYQTGWKDGWYSLVSGHLDGDESVHAAMIREAAEEAGIILTKEDLSPATVMHRKSDQEYIDFFFAATTWEGEPRIMEPHKSDELGWFPLDALPDNVLPNVLEALQQYRDKRAFSITGWTK